jgi:uncharacterized protein YbjT (DUF2867 family)
MAAQQTPKKLLVIGASGIQGSGVVKHSLAAGHDVYAMVRDPAGASAAWLRETRATLVQGDLDDEELVRRAVAGMDAVFFFVLPQGLEAEARQTRGVLAAVRAAGTVSTLVYTGVVHVNEYQRYRGWGPSHPMYEYWLAKERNEELVREAAAAAGPAMTAVVVRLPNFLQNFLAPKSTFMFPELAGQGLLRSIYSRDTNIEVADVTDVGHVVVDALAHPDAWRNRTFDLVADVLTVEELVAKMNKGSGKSIRAEFPPLEVMEAERGPLLSAAANMYNDLDLPKVTPEVYRNLKLTSVEDFFAEHKDGILSSN